MDTAVLDGTGQAEVASRPLPASLVGEGGMGQVWQATDTQLNRQVALKILPDAFADDPDRLARFTREAQILGSLIRQTNTRLTCEDDPAGFPIWTPDGTRVAFGSPLAWKAADGTGEVEPFSESPQTFPQAFSQDEAVLVVETQAGRVDIVVVALDSDGTVSLLLQEEFTEHNAAISPDGQWIAYESDETGPSEIYVRPFPDTDSGRWEVSSNGGVMAVWNPAWSELFFRGADGLMALAFEAEPTFRPGAVTRLCDLTPYSFTGDNRRLAVDPDGQRFLILKDMTDQTGTDEATAPQITVVLNWFEELMARMPTP